MPKRKSFGYSAGSKRAMRKEFDFKNKDLTPQEAKDKALMAASQAWLNLFILQGLVDKAGMTDEQKAALDEMIEKIEIFG